MSFPNLQPRMRMATVAMGMLVGHPPWPSEGIAWTHICLPVFAAWSAPILYQFCSFCVGQHWVLTGNYLLLFSLLGCIDHEAHFSAMQRNLLLLGFAVHSSGFPTRIISFRWLLAEWLHSRLFWIMELLFGIFSFRDQEASILTVRKSDVLQTSLDQALEFTKITLGVFRWLQFRML